MRIATEFKRAGGGGGAGRFCTGRFLRSDTLLHIDMMLRAVADVELMARVERASNRPVVRAGSCAHGAGGVDAVPLVSTPQIYQDEINQHEPAASSEKYGHDPDEPPSFGGVSASVVLTINEAKGLEFYDVLE